MHGVISPKYGETYEVMRLHYCQKQPPNMVAYPFASYAFTAVQAHASSDRRPGLALVAEEQ